MGVADMLGLLLGGGRVYSGHQNPIPHRRSRHMQHFENFILGIICIFSRIFYERLRFALCFFFHCAAAQIDEGV